MNEERKIDRATLDALRQELGANFGRILGYFTEDGAKSILAIEEAARVRSAVALVRPAHTLKGESLQFGATTLGSTAERIEMAARQAVEDHDFPLQIVEDVVQLRPLFDHAVAVLTRQAQPAVPAMPMRRAAGGFGRKVGA